MTDFGMSAASAPLNDQGESEYDMDVLRGDPGMAACCIRDMNDRKKANELMSKLRAVDPVRKAENRYKDVLKLPTPKIEHHHHSSNCGCAGDVSDALSSLNNSEQHASEDEEDDDLEDELAMLRKMRLNQLQEQAESDQEAVAESTYRIVAAADDVRTCLESAGSNGAVVCIVGTSHESSNELYLTLIREATKLSTATQRAPRKVITSVLCIDDADSTVVSNVTNGQFISQSSLPALAILRDRCDPVFVQRMTLQNLCLGEDCWLTTLVRKVTGIECDGAQCEGNDNESDNGDETPQYCSKPGCGRNFPHEHITSQSKYSAFT